MPVTGSDGRRVIDVNDGMRQSKQVNEAHKNPLTKMSEVMDLTSE